MCYSNDTQRNVSTIILIYEIILFKVFVQNLPLYVNSALAEDHALQCLLCKMRRIEASPKNGRLIDREMADVNFTRMH